MTLPNAAVKRTTLLALGLPGSGKTTFLAAFWHAVEQGTLGTALTVDRVDGDRAYLNRIAREWADGCPLERTSVTGGATVQMSLRDTQHGGRFSMVFPDLAGELFREAWAERAWPRTVADAATDAAGLLMFVHPDVAEPIRLDTLHRAAVAAGAAEAPPAPGTPSGVEEEADEVPWDPRRSPHAVMLVDLLQAVLDLRRLSPAVDKLRVAVVVSAWDRVDRGLRFSASSSARHVGHATPENTQAVIQPGQWTKKRLPLLAQFLRNNRDAVESRIYGLSAQGGDLDSDAALLREAFSPESRIRVVETSGASTIASDSAAALRVHHDLTAIVNWVDGAAAAEPS